MSTPDGQRALDEVLAEVVSQFGRRIVDRPAQLRAALSDTYGASAPQNGAQLEAAVAASHAGVAAAIRDADPAVPASAEQIRAWFDQLAAAGLSLRDAALATSSWATAFDASETARRTSEVTDSMLAEAAPPAGPHAAVATAQPAAPGIDGLTDVTMLPDGDEADRTEMVVPVAGRSVAPTPPAAVPPAPRPLGAPVGAPSVAWLPPTGAPIVPAPPAGAASLATVPRSSPLALARVWWPSVAAVVAVAVTAAVCVPLLAGRDAPVAASTATPVPDELPAPRLFAKGDLAQFVMTDEVLEQLVGGGDANGLYAASEEWARGYNSPGFVTWTVPSRPECEPLLRAVPPLVDRDSSGALGNEVFVEGRSVVSTARAYATEATAASAFERLRADPSCLFVDVVQPEGTFSAEVTLHAQFPDYVFDRLAFEGYELARSCRLQANVIACVYTDRRPDTPVLAHIGGRNIWGIADDLVADARPFDPRGGDR